LEFDLRHGSAEAGLVERRAELLLTPAAIDLHAVLLGQREELVAAQLVEGGGRRGVVAGAALALDDVLVLALVGRGLRRAGVRGQLARALEELGQRIADLFVRRGALTLGRLRVSALGSKPLANAADRRGTPLPFGELEHELSRRCVPRLDHQA